MVSEDELRPASHMITHAKNNDLKPLYKRHVIATVLAVSWERWTTSWNKNHQPPTSLPHLAAPLHVIMRNYTDLCWGWAVIHNQPVVLHKNIHIHQKRNMCMWRQRCQNIPAKPLGKQKVKLSNNFRIRQSRGWCITVQCLSKAESALPTKVKGLPLLTHASVCRRSTDRFSHPSHKELDVFYSYKKKVSLTLAISDLMYSFSVMRLQNISTLFSTASHRYINSDTLIFWGCLFGTCLIAFHKLHFSPYPASTAVLLHFTERILGALCSQKVQQ